MSEAALAAYNHQPRGDLDLPRLRLVAIDGELIDDVTTPEDELTERRTQRLGHAAIEAVQAKLDAITEIAEGIDGQMISIIEIIHKDGELYGSDGRSLIGTADNGVKDAERAARNNPNLEFEVPRRKEERQELDAVLEAFETGKANVVFVTTDYPHALEDVNESVGGYNHVRKQALNRVWLKNSRGEIKLISRTLDGSNRQALEAVHADLGFETKEGEMLGQRRLMNLTDEEQDRLLNRTTKVYDQKMTELFGGEWHAGRRPIDYRNTFEFARHQHDLVEVYVEAKLSNQLTDSFMYNLLATANARFEKDPLKRERQSSTSVLSAAGVETNFNRTSYSKEAVLWEMQTEGRFARRSGKTFSACGSTYKGEGSDESSAERAGLGKSWSESRSWHGGKKFYNSECRSCKKVKKEVGACHICEDCVKNPKKHSSGGSKTTRKPVTYAVPGQNSNHKKSLKSKASRKTAHNSVSYII